MRRDFSQRLLRKNHRRATPSRMIFYDAETKKLDLEKRQLHRMKLAWTCYYERRWRDTKDTEVWSEWRSTFPFCEYVARKAREKTVLYLFGHNIFFDLQVSDFFHYFTLWGWELQFIYEASHTYILIIRKGQATIKVCSTTNYFPESLKTLGKMIDLEKHEVDFDSVDDKTLSAYCKRDVEIIKRVMQQYFDFIQTYDLGKFGLTRAAQSLNAYRHRFMEKRIYLHSTHEVQELERAAYMGGRVECFQLGKIDNGPFLSLDINSMYPYVMRNHNVPVKLLDYRENENPANLYDLFERFCSVAEVVVNTQRPAYAVRSNGKIIFPTGTFTAYVCTAFLQDALFRGELLEVKRLAIYEGTCIFDRYVDFFYSLRKRFKAEGNAVYDQFCKYLLNSLYGKFAQYRPVTERTKTSDNKGYYRLENLDLDTGKRFIEYKLFNTIVREMGKETAPNSFVAIAAHITEWARFILHTIIETTGRNYVLYCDTDSVKIRKEHLPFVTYYMDDHALGALKVEDEFNELTIYGPKSYETEHSTIFKGVPKTAKRLSNTSFSYLSWPKQKTHMRQQITRYYIIDKIEKSLKLQYDKGVVHPDGHITPLQLGEPY